MATILVVDDDRAIRDVVCFALTLMPEFDGTDVCRTLRRTSTVPILFLSPRG